MRKRWRPAGGGLGYELAAACGEDFRDLVFVVYVGCLGRTLCVVVWDLEPIPAGGRTSAGPLPCPTLPLYLSQENP